MNASTIVEIIVCTTPIIGVPLMVWFDPAHLRPVSESVPTPMTTPTPATPAPRSE